MPRIARAVLPGVPHHLTQRTLDRRAAFFANSDYELYLAMIRGNARRFGVDLLGYCCMPNHVHWIATPREPDSLARTFGEAHGRYAIYANTKLGRNGHFWQNRFFSCALDPHHLLAALRYVERNPVRANMVQRAAAFPWSSAAVHTGLAPHPDWLYPEPLRSAFTREQWETYLRFETIGDAELALRINTYTGRPAGSREFVRWAEAHLDRRLEPQRGGRPRKINVGTARMFPG